MASIIRQQFYTTKNGKRVKGKSQCWYIDYRGQDGIRKRVKGYKDKQATQQLAAKLEREAELKAAGLIDKFADHRKTPLKEHIKDFETYLASKANTKNYVCQTNKRVRVIFDECKLLFWNDISGSRIQQGLKNMRFRGKPLSSATAGYYVQSIKQFCKWMVMDGRAPESPITYLQKPRNIKCPKRAFQLSELINLFSTTIQLQNRFGIDGNERVLVYLVAVETGLRANELRSLKVGNFDFQANTVEIYEADAKNRNSAVIPLRKQTAQKLKTFFEGKLPSVQAFNLPNKYRMAKNAKSGFKGCKD